MHKTCQDFFSKQTYVLKIGNDTLSVIKEEQKHECTRIYFNPVVVSKSQW